MQKVGRVSLLGYSFLAAIACGGTTRTDPEGTGGTASGGMVASGGGKPAGSGGSASGTGGASTGSGGTSKGSGGTTPSSGGRATGGKGSGGAPGKGGSSGAGGGRPPDACLISSDCDWGEIDREILSADACPCLYGCPGIALSRETIQRRQAQYDALCTPGRDGKGQPCGIDDCIVPPPLACIAQRCMAPRP
jgi:hypothetical protein